MGAQHRFKKGELVKVIRPRPYHPQSWLHRVCRVMDVIEDDPYTGDYYISRNGFDYMPVYDDELGGV